MKKTGSISDLLKVRPNFVKLQPGETKQLRAQFSSGNNTLGNYSGMVKVLLVS